MKRHWMPLYIPDYLADTMGLTAEQSGAYLHAIMHYWVTGGLPWDDAEAMIRVTKIAPRRWGLIRPVLRQFFRSDGTHKRIEAEIEKAENLSIHRQIAGQKGAAISHGRNNVNRAIASDLKQAIAKQLPGQAGEQLQSKKDKLLLEAARAGPGQDVSKEEGSPASLATALPEGRARSPASQAPSPAAMNGHGHIVASADLAALIKRKGW